MELIRYKTKHMITLPAQAGITQNLPDTVRALSLEDARQEKLPDAPEN